MTRLSAGALVSVFVLSLGVVVITPWCTRDRASAAAYVGALQAAPARELLHRGDVVLVHPPWRDDVVKAARAANILPPGVSVTTALAPRHGEPLPSLVVIHDRGLALPPSLASRVADTSLVRAGDIEIVRIANVTPGGARDGRRDLADVLARANVEVRSADDEAVPCPWDALRQRHVCASLPEWMYVGVQELPVGGARERCVWAHPISGGAVHIRWENVLVEGDLTLDVALTDGAADNRAGAPVSIELLVDGVSKGGVSTVSGKRGFVSRAFSTVVEGGAGSDAAVELVVKTANDGQRHTCFRLTTGGAR